MQDLFELTPELLLEQSQEMFSLCSAYENLFSNISSDLNGINGSWSDLLSNNFSGKIGSAQKAFSGALSMLQNSANSARSVAETAQEMDTAWASKISSSMAGQSLSDLRNNPYFMQGVLNLMNWDPAAESKEALELLDKLKEKAEDVIPSSVRAWIEFLGKQADKKFFDGNVDKAIDLTTQLLEGDLEGFGKDAELLVLKEVFKEAVKGTAGDPVNIMGFKYDPTTKYYINMGLGIGEGLGEFAQEPSWENLTEIAWNASVKPVLETAGSTVETVTQLIPGISEYYYDENGAEDIGDAAGIALGDLYRLFTPDEDIKEYASNYYKDGMWEGLWGGFEDIGSFIKDSGGPGEAAKNFFSTAYKDSQENLDHMAENAGYLWDSIEKLIGGAKDDSIAKTLSGGGGAAF